MAAAPSSTDNQSHRTTINLPDVFNRNFVPKVVTHDAPNPGPSLFLSPPASQTLTPAPPSASPVGPSHASPAPGLTDDGWTYDHTINLADAINRKFVPKVPHYAPNPGPPPASLFISPRSGSTQDGSLDDPSPPSWTFKCSPSPSLQDLSDNQFRLATFVRTDIVEKGDGYTVYMVMHVPTRQFFASKAFRLSINDSTRTLIAQELKISQSFRCPYVAACYQSFYEKGIFSTIFEYMNGGTLVALLKKVKTIPEQYLAAICKQVLRGLLYIHEERHIIHWDVRPSNLLWNRRGEVKIMGFDITSSLFLMHLVPANTSLDMCYKYSSPEVLHGDGPDHKSGIWSLGLVLLECATGQYPYIPPVEREGWFYRTELREIILDKPLPSAPSNQFSKEFCSFISACLQKNPKDRASYQELTKHTFIKMYDNLDIDLSSYFKSAR